ncbi:MAG: S41 family peptidase [Ardenticatenaceae bacterium]|nr:S41 family peptidase [Ardenticatenaceae bacterium]MCB8989585.1 S41 family peptidase [Ardenticatenaceae bacterium]MCB9003128.1 S41 family peptidase [Ardenticatenaceae bacterium]
MTNQTRKIVTILLLALLAASAFVAGYFTNDFIELRSGGTLVRQRQPFDVFWEAWNLVQSNFIGDLPDDQAMTYAAIRGVMQSLNDPYTVFIEPVVRDQERDSLRGSFGGVGAYIRRPEEGGDVLLEPIPGNPAEIAGILTGDVLVAVDGMMITPEMTVQEIADMIRGEKGTAVILTVIHPGDTESVDVSVMRDDILIPSVSYRMLDTDMPIGYIQLTRFSGESGNEVKAALEDLLDQGAEGLILDLRGNGGGLLTAAVDVASHFLDAGVVVTQQSRREGEREEKVSGETIAPDIPLIVLVDGGTASASEILAGALQDHGRAVLIGQQTFGKGSVQLVFDLSDGSSVHVTSARWFTPNGHQIDQQGLTPDVLVEVTQEDIDLNRDVMLNQAIEELTMNN